MRLSLRWLLLVGVLGTVTIGFAAFSVYIDQVERGNRLDDIDIELVRAERSSLPLPPVPEGAGPPPEPLVDGETERPDDGAPPPPENPENQATPGEPEETENLPLTLVVAPDGTVANLSRQSNPFDSDVLAALITVEGTSTEASANYRVRVDTGPRGAVRVTALNLDPFDEAVGRFRGGLLGGGLVILGLVAAIIWILTGFLARPVARITATANRIADGHFDTAIPPPSGSRETVELSQDLDRMLRRLRGSIADATNARDDMQRLIADMAHEIRTPLTALKGYSDLHQKGMLSEPADVDRAMRRIGSESERLSDLANGILRLASEGTATVELEGASREEFDIAAVVEEVASDLRAAYPDQFIVVEVAPGVHEVPGARDKLHQVMLNLGSNACHHNPVPEPITFSVSAETSTRVVRVCDNGPGIDRADRERVFLPFYRSDSARSREGQSGSGLGLALAKQIIDRHGGQISVGSQPNGGACFEIALPVSSKDQGSPALDL